MALAVVAVVACAVPAAADPWHVHYGTGLERLAKGDATAAVREMSEALRRRPDSACRARTYGVHFNEYLPHYYRGVALMGEGREAEAALELSRELAAGIIDACPSSMAEAADLRVRLSELALRAKPPAPSPAPAEPATAVPSRREPQPESRPVPEVLRADARELEQSAGGIETPPECPEPSQGQGPRAASRRRVPPLLSAAWSTWAGSTGSWLPAESR